MTRLALACLLALAACGPDLPSDWSGAERLAVTQHECADLDGEMPEPSFDAKPAAGGAAVSFRSVMFRCQQQVEGFVRRGAGTVEVLLQPVDMDPTSVPRCSCRFDVDASVAASGKATWSGFTRQDNVGGAHAPERVGRTVSLELP